MDRHSWRWQLGLGLAVLGFRYVQSQMAFERDERALDQVTTSELVPLRLTPADGNVGGEWVSECGGSALLEITITFLTQAFSPASPAVSLPVAPTIAMNTAAVAMGVEAFLLRTVTFGGPIAARNEPEAHDINQAMPSPFRRVAPRLCIGAR